MQHKAFGWFNADDSITDTEECTCGLTQQRNDTNDPELDYADHDLDCICYQGQG